MIKDLLNSVIAKYPGFSVCRRSIACLSIRLRQISDLLPTDPHSLFDRMERNQKRIASSFTEQISRVMFLVIIL